MKVLSNRLFLMALVYAVMLVFFYAVYGNLITTAGAAVAAIGVLLCGLSLVSNNSWLRNWIPFLTIIFSYEALGGIYRAAESTRGVFEVYRLDHALWGFNMTGAVQTTLMSKSFTSFMTDVYALHLPLVVFSAFFLWYVNRRAYRKYLYSISLVVFLSLFTFLSLPSAPPWYSGQALNLLASNGASKSLYSTLSSIVESDPLAAFPSLHAGLALLFLYGMWSARRLYGVLAIPVVFLVLLSTVYLGQHFTVDLLAGGIYSLVGVFFAERFSSNIITGSRIRRVPKESRAERS
ncbi:MAG: phosphatase PAP2 family protein [Nitrososphaerota archaeon]|nr:phosphatase PAP2 family protein [Nitrososphaerota archaeon]